MANFRIWAPWRLSYVKDASKDIEEECIFCAKPAAEDDEANLIVHRGERCFAILNRFPYGTGHLLVMPYREVADLAELDDDEHTELWLTVRDAVAALRSAYEPDGVNVGANLGEAAGAGVPGHIHVHVLPRWSADSNFMTSVAETRVLPEALPDTWDKVTAAWPTPPATP